MIKLSYYKDDDTIDVCYYGHIFYELSTMELVYWLCFIADNNLSVTCIRI